MCGLVGAAGDLTGKEERAFKTLLILDVLRGEHSTGIAAVFKNKEAPQVVKSVGTPFDLFYDKRCEDVFRKPNRVLIGHNRYATQGAVNRRNAHPFEFENVIGAHNGTLTSRWQLDDNKDFDVDSQSLYNHVSRNGIKDAIEKIQGAYALTWWDKEHQTINFLRNRERPLFMCHSEDGKCMFWASEKWMLSVALSRNDVKHGDIGELIPDLWVSIPVDAKGAMGEGVNEKLEAPKPKATTTTHTGTALPKGDGKTSVVPFRNSVPVMPEGYLSLKDVVLEVTGRVSQGIGYHYYTFENPLDPKVKFRMFTSKTQLVKGDIVTADVAGWTTQEGGYFRLNPASWDFVVEEEKKIALNS